MTTSAEADAVPLASEIASTRPGRSAIRETTSVQRFSIVHVVLPSLARDLELAPGTVEWVVKP
jgi:hypothetical protein